MKSLPKGLTSGNGVKKDKCWPVIGPFSKFFFVGGSHRLSISILKKFGVE
jgi:hypothetical protein